MLRIWHLFDVLASTEILISRYYFLVPTVHSKLKRLDIVPLVCTVEQIRLLRGLGGELINLRETLSFYFNNLSSLNQNSPATWRQSV